MMKSGVYQIYNPITEKRYIGSSLDIVCRLKQHRRNLIAGKSVNNGFMKKLKCKFSYITEQEFMVPEFYKLHYNKTTGEK